LLKGASVLTTVSGTCVSSAPVSITPAVSFSSTVTLQRGFLSADCASIFATCLRQLAAFMPSRFLLISKNVDDRYFEADLLVQYFEVWPTPLQPKHFAFASFSQSLAKWPSL